MFTNIQKSIGLISLWFIVSLVLVFFPYQWVIGVIPRNIVGIPGIWGSPFFHGGLGHLMSNAIPMYILGCLVSVEMSRQGFIWTNFLLITASGSLLWVFGRSAEHIGASGLIFAYLGYLISSWWHGPRGIISSITTIVALLLYWTIIPSIIFDMTSTRSVVSWDGHLCGLIAGYIVGKYQYKRNSQ